MKKIGYAYTHKKGDKTYLSGQVEIVIGHPTKIVLFKNDQKKSAKSPDWNIVLSEPIKNIKIENKDDF